jgi:hypothetical protein
MNHDESVLSWTNLPEEISLRIFQFLDVLNLSFTMASCKVWRKIAGDDVLWRPIVEVSMHISQLKYLRSKFPDIDWHGVFLKQKESEKNKYIDAIEFIKKNMKKGFTFSEHFSGIGLTKLPPEIRLWSNVTALVLANNKLRTIPPELCLLHSLEYLYLEQNLLSTLPAELIKIKNLESLTLDGNLFHEIPAPVYQLKRLKYLYAKNNFIRDVPIDITALKHLSILDMSGNQIESVTAGIGALHKLKVLLLHSNNIKEIPPSLVSLKYLDILRVHNNPLEEPFAVYGAELKMSAKEEKEKIEKIFGLLKSIHGDPTTSESSTKEKKSKKR